MGCCVIFCAAEFDALARPLEKDDYILAADGGLKHTRKLGIEPNETIGDFDSLGFTPPAPRCSRWKRTTPTPCLPSAGGWSWGIGSSCFTEVWTAPGLTTPWPISRRCNFSPTGAPWAIS